MYLDWIELDGLNCRYHNYVALCRSVTQAIVKRTCRKSSARCGR
jgi:hypothetical protein